MLYRIASKLQSRIKDKNPILDIIDDLNNSNLYLDSVLVSFHTINIFHSIDNKMKINTVIRFSNERVSKDPPKQCVIDARVMSKQMTQSKGHIYCTCTLI